MLLWCNILGQCLALPRRLLDVVIAWLEFECWYLVTGLFDGVVAGVVEGLGVSGLNSTCRRVHLLRFLVQRILRMNSAHIVCLRLFKETYLVFYVHIVMSKCV